MNITDQLARDHYLEAVMAKVIAGNTHAQAVFHEGLGPDGWTDGEDRTREMAQMVANHLETGATHHATDLGLLLINQVKAYLLRCGEDHAVGGVSVDGEYRKLASSQRRAA